MATKSSQYRMRELQMMNDLELKYDSSKIKQAIIRPIGVKPNTNIESDYNNYKNKLNNELKELHNTRTNVPYKNIIKDPKYLGAFIAKPNPKNETERKKLENKLVVHKVTVNDKEGVNDKFNTLNTNIEKHNDELKSIYSTSKEVEHKKKFEYNHKFKYKINYDQSTHEKLKEDRITYYKKKQEELEDGNKKYLEIIENCLSKGIIEENEDITPLSTPPLAPVPVPVPVPPLPTVPDKKKLSDNQKAIRFGRSVAHRR